MSYCFNSVINSFYYLLSDSTFNLVPNTQTSVTTAFSQGSYHLYVKTVKKRNYSYLNLIQHFRNPKVSIDKMNIIVVYYLILCFSDKTL